MALTKLDILDGFAEIKIGIEYRKDGKILDYFPSSEQVLQRSFWDTFELFGWSRSW